jgi:hypothetical protein
MLSKRVVSLAFAASLMAAPAAFAQSTDLPPAAPAAPADQSMTTPAPTPTPMNPAATTPAPADQAMTTGAPATDLVTNGPQANPGDHARNWSAARNVRESEWYDHLVATSPGFRHYREAKECGPINDPGLHSQCLASFDTGAEARRYGASRMYGSSRPPHPIRNSAGASQ